MKHETIIAPAAPVPAAAPTGASASSAPRPPGAYEMPVLSVILAGVLAYAWLRRDEGDMTAEYGLGYALGITGGLMMLVLLLYPLRKRLRALRMLGNIPGWFRIHMLLGVIGPVLVVLHSNFSLGSLNSTAAMLSMLVVAGSGYIGRFLYSRIHRGLYGHKQSVQEHLAAVDQIKARLCGSETAPDPTLGPDVVVQLTRYQAGRVSGANGVWGSFRRTLTGPFSRAMLRRKLLATLRQQIRIATPQTRKREEHDFLAALDRYFTALGRAEAFTFYERGFAAWHLLHLPLFFILVLATIAHIVAVHLY